MINDTLEHIILSAIERYSDCFPEMWKHAPFKYFILCEGSLDDDNCNGQYQLHPFVHCVGTNGNTQISLSVVSMEELENWRSTPNYKQNIASRLDVNKASQDFIRGLDFFEKLRKL